MEKIAAAGNIVTLKVKLFDTNGIQCLDAVNRVRFSLAGDGRLMDNLGASSGARLVQVYNGRGYQQRRRECGKSEGIPIVTLHLKFAQVLKYQ